MDQIEVDVREQEDIARSRRAARSLASQIGLDMYQTGEVEAGVSELATNLVRHAGGGIIRLEIVDREGRQGLKVTSLDQGPGIPDIALAMSEGYSTGTTLGSGLPAVRRMMDEFDIESEPGTGTKVVAVKWR